MYYFGYKPYQPQQVELCLLSTIYITDGDTFIRHTTCVFAQASKENKQKYFSNLKSVVTQVIKIQNLKGYFKCLKYYLYMKKCILIIINKCLIGVLP